MDASLKVIVVGKTVSLSAVKFPWKTALINRISTFSKAAFLITSEEVQILPKSSVLFIVPDKITVLCVSI